MNNLASIGELIKLCCIIGENVKVIRDFRERMTHTLHIKKKLFGVFFKCFIGRLNII
jgi:hypothetical protein